MARTKKVKDGLRCIRCDQIKQVKDFPTNKFVKNNLGKEMYCRTCRDAYIQSEDELANYLFQHGIVYSRETFNKAVEATEKQDWTMKTKQEKFAYTVSKYFSLSNLPQHHPKLIESEKPEINNEEIDEDLIRFWGRFKDYTNEDYEFLQDNYDSWIMECKSDTLAEKKLYKQICMQELEIKKLREKGCSVIKEVDTLQKLMDSANVKPKDINAANDPSNATVLGMIIKDIEQYRPCEYFEDKKLYADFDGIKDYWQRFVTRPLKNLLLGSRDFDKEFNLESDSSDSDE